MLVYHDVRTGTGRGFYSDLVGRIADLGHDVTVVAPGADGDFGLREEGGLRVLRVKTGKMFGVNKIVKGINNLRLPGCLQSAIDQNFNNESFDWIVSPTPPITLAPLVKNLKRRFGCKSYLILRDIFPQNARDLGLIKNSLIFNFFRRKEKLLYKLSDLIGCMSQGNVEYVMRHNPEVDQSKLTLLPNWIGCDQDELARVDSAVIKARFGLGGKFVALFGGNFGKPQKIEAILELAASVKSTHPDIAFLMIGKGTEKARVANLVAEQKLTNVVLKDRLPLDDYLLLAAACDAGMVNLSEKFTIPNIPSRTLAYWASGLPVLASVDANTDLGAMLESAQAGLWSVTGDLKSYRDNLLNLYNDSDTRLQMGENGRQAICDHYATEIVATEFDRQISECSMISSPAQTREHAHG